MKKLFRFICKIFCSGNVGPDPSKPKTLLSYRDIVTMLHEYDNSRFELLVNGLGFEDTRVNTLDFYELKNYLAFMEREAKKRNISLKGISFIKGVYTEENSPKPEFINYENLLYTPTTIIEGKEVEIDVLNSTRESVVTLKSKLQEYNYEWRYDDKKNYKLKSSKKAEDKIMKTIMRNDGFSDEESGLANKTHLSPPN
ncbi:conserved hypothetical protein [Tenacibaculum sp. 190524A05c]|uniref:hypothetical protein n=1 Tax=Tenacibaculum platacis TaxID=3137852 RepID=UPI0031FB5BC3